MFKPGHLLVFASFAPIAASASPPKDTAAFFVLASGPQCFRSSDVSAYTAGPAGFVNVRATGNRWYQMRLSAGCPRFSEMMSVGIRPKHSNWLCEGKGDELIVERLMDRCFVSDIRQLAPGEIPRTT
jgi:hypothetical protein